MLRKLLLIALSGLAGCALNDVGISELQSGDRQKAFASFTECANAGDPHCISNLGLMWERGLVDGTPNIELATRYYTLAARLGDPVAQQSLIKLGATVPVADLQAAYVEKERQRAAERQRLGNALLRAAFGNGGTPPSPVPAQPPIVTPALGFATAGGADCTNDMQCGYGKICIKPAGTFGGGTCVQPVDKNGMKVFGTLQSSLGPREVPSCQFFNDCPMGFNCTKKPGQMHGLCIKP